MEDLSIDQNNLPGVREVCRDFTVREDYSLAHNLQEQEIESHLASNIHKSRLAQQDLRVAKRLQEEEDKHAKAQSQKKYQDLERSDNRIAKEIQEQLVRQAEQQRQQEEKDEAIARKLQEREMKEERKRQKQMDAKLDEQFYEDKGACRPPSDPRVQYPGADFPVYNSEKYQDLNRGQSPDHRSPKLETKKGLESQNHPKSPTQYYPNEMGHSKGLESSKSEHSRAKHYPAEKGPPNVSETSKTDKWPEHHISKLRAKHRKEYGDEDYLETQNSRKYQSLPININNNQEINPTKDRSYRDDQSDRNRERNRRKDSEQEWEREEWRNGEKRRMHRDKSQDRIRDRHRHKEGDRDSEQNGYRHRIRDVDVDRHGRRAKDKERHHTRDRNRGEELEDDPSLHATGRHWSEEDGDADYSSRHRLYDEVFEEPRSRNHSKAQSPHDRGRSVPEEYGMREATQSLAQMNLRSQELHDMEVARRLQEEELKVNQVERRAAQVAQDEEIARRLMEEEELEYKWSREKEKEAMERGHRRADGDFRPMQEEALQPRTRDEYDYKKAKNPKSPRLPPRTHHYENVESHYGYSDNFPPRPTRPEAAYKGAYYRQ